MRFFLSLVCFLFLFPLLSSCQLQRTSGFDFPTGLCTDGQGTVFIMNNNGFEIDYQNVTMSYKQQIGVGLSSPLFTGMIDCMVEGGQLYVLTSSNSIGQVYTVSLPINFQSKITPIVKFSAKFSYGTDYHGIIMDEKGSIYVSASSNVLANGKLGVILQASPANGYQQTTYFTTNNTIHGLAYLGSGNLVYGSPVVESSGSGPSAAIFHLDPALNSFMMYGDHISAPAGITVAPNGDMYVCDYDYGIYSFKAKSHIRTNWNLNAFSCHGIVIDNSKYLWFSQARNGTVSSVYIGN